MQVVLHGAGVQPKGDSPCQHECVGRYGVKDFGKRVRCARERRVELGVAVLDGQRQDDRLHIGKADARVADGVAARDGMPLERVSTHRMPAVAQQLRQPRLTHVAADDRKGRGTNHRKNLLRGSLCRRRARCYPPQGMEKPAPCEGNGLVSLQAWRSPPRKQTTSVSGPVCAPMTVPI